MSIIDDVLQSQQHPKPVSEQRARLLAGRASVGSLQAMGAENPMGYLQAVLGDIRGGLCDLTYDDLEVDELRALCDQSLGFQRSSASMGDAKGVADMASVIDACLEVLRARGQEWHPSDPPARDDPINPPTPPHDPSRGRNPT